MRALQLAMIPDDETGQVLRRMVEDGDDLALERPIGFFHVFAEESDAQDFAAAASARPDLVVEGPDFDDDDGIWEVTATRTMPAQHKAITALEAELAGLAQQYRGYPDGWGCDPATVTQRP